MVEQQPMAMARRESATAVNEMAMAVGERAVVGEWLPDKLVPGSEYGGPAQGSWSTVQISNASNA